jgi:antitoxin HicB
MEIVEDEGAWVASIPDLPGCNSFGATITEAVENVQKTKQLWIQGQYESKDDIPEPTDEDSFSGKFVLRIPKVLHRSLFYEARKQGVSLNHYASHLLSARQPLNAFENLAQTFITSCQSYRPGPWEIYGRHEHGKTLMVGKLAGDTALLAYVRKPPAQYNYKTPPIPASARKIYQVK